MSLRPLLTHLADDPQGATLARDGRPRLRLAVAARLRRRRARRRAPRPGARRSSSPATTARPATSPPTCASGCAPRPVRFYPSRGVAYESHLAPPPHLVGLRVAALDALLDAADADAHRGDAEPPGRRRLGRRAEREGPRPGAAPARLHAAPSATCSTSTRSRPTSSPPATSASTRSTTAASSPCAAASSTSSRPRRTAPSASTSSTSRSSRCAVLDLHPALAGRARRRRDRARRRAGRRAPRAGRDRRAGGRRGPPRRRELLPVDRFQRLPRPRARATPRSSSPPRRRSSPRWPTTGRTSAPPSTTPTPTTSTSSPRRSRAALDERARIRLSLDLRRPAARVPRPGRRRRRPLAARRRARAREARALGLPHGRRLAAARRRRARRLQPRARCRPRWLATARRRRPRRAALRRRPACATASSPPALKLAVLPEHRLFRRRRAERAGGRPRRPRRGALRSFADLRTGDIVVHEDHGVARFAGFETKTVARRHARLPPARVRRHRPASSCRSTSWPRSAATSAPAARTRRCPSSAASRWETIKARARRAAQELAGELLNLYAERRAASGHAFPEDSEWLREFEAQLPLAGDAPTSARRSSTSRPTWSAAQPMDRLICGDVGYGKTEVALRAAFKAADDGKQVLVLAPTTILAQQHYGTFAERLQGLPVHRRARLPLPHAQGAEGGGRPPSTRARSTSSSAPTACSAATCAARTSACSSSTRSSASASSRRSCCASSSCKVDVIAMSATPIPRTLQMSLAGLRDISVIETPPEGRRPVKTYVGEYDEELVKQAIMREKRARRPGVLRAQPRRDDRRDRRAPARAVPGRALRGRPRPARREGARGADALASCAARPTCWWPRASSSRASTSRRPTR